MSETDTLRDALSRYAREGELYHNHKDGSLTCFACGHRCLIRQGRAGICKVRFNRGGKLFVPHGYTAGLQCDPVEKKPFYHVLPGASALTFGMLGCDFHCGYCQNWLTSQSLRDAEAVALPRPATPSGLVEFATRVGARLVVSSYNEPLITSEWAMRVFAEAKRAGLVTGYVSNGNATPEVLDYIRPHTDLYKIDFKSFSDKHYRQLGGVLSSVLSAIRMVHERGFWLEVVTLLVPGFNDSEAEIADMAGFLRGVSPEIPWHITGFHPDYKMSEVSDTPTASLLRAAGLAKAAGLKFVYAGNRPGGVGGYEDTTCPECDALIIRRFVYRILENRLDNGCCPGCGGVIPGVWATAS